MTSKISLEELVHQRHRLWHQYDEAKKQERELNRYTDQFSSSSHSQRIPNLSNTSTPPDEIAAVVWQLKQKADEISKAKSRIQSYQEDIKKTEREFFYLFGLLIVSVMIVLIVTFSS